MAVLFSHTSSPDSKPKVAVLISLYNYKHFIIQCLESVASQTIGNIELVICDDCSRDGGAELVKEWLQLNCECFISCRLLQNEHNQGLAYSRNTAIAHSNAPFVFILDADNMIYPRCLERLWDALQTSDAAFAYCALEMFGDTIGLMGLSDWRPEMLCKGNVIDAMVLHRKSDLLSVGCYTKMKVAGWEDFDLWFKYARAGKFGIRVHEILARYRVHGSSMLRTTTNVKFNHTILWEELRRSYPEFFTSEPLQNTYNPAL
jgi:glycosyltransferase involved in cell wall biosynthesis